MTDTKTLIKLSELKVGELYTEHLPDEDPNNEESCEVLILVNDLPNMVVYLGGFYNLSPTGKKFILENNSSVDTLTDALNAIPDDDYRETPYSKFFDKHGFYDGGIIFYDKIKDEFTLDSDYVGSVTFSKEKPKHEFMLTPEPDDTLEELCEYIEARIRFLDYIVVEAFKMVSFHGQNLEAIEQIGVIKLISRVNNVPYVLQQPSVRKPFEFRVGFCSTPHEKSAIAHGLYFLNKMKVKV